MPEIMTNTTKTILEQEKSLQEAKNQKIQELLKSKSQTEKDYLATKKQIAADLKALGWHTPRPRKVKAEAK